MKPITKVKAGTLKNHIDWIITKFGEQRLQDVLQKLTEEDRRSITDPMLLVSSWIEMDTFINFYKAVVEVLATGDESIISTLAEESSRKELRGIYKIFIKFASPGHVIRKAARIMPIYYNSGEAVCQLVEKNKAILTIRGFQQKHHLIEHNLVGFCNAALQLSGAKNPTVVVTKSIADSEELELVGTW